MSRHLTMFIVVSIIEVHAFMVEFI